MKIFVYLDESGSIHKNSSTKYFAVGGYFTFEKDKNDIISRYKNIILKYKYEHNINEFKEVKGRDMPIYLKKELLLNLQSIDSFYGITKIFDKSNMRKNILNSNVFFNYAVRLIFDDCILPLLDLKNINENMEFIVKIDNRNLKFSDIFNLEEYLNIEYAKYNYLFKVTYCDSKSTYSIQIADLIVNTFYNYFKMSESIFPVYKLLILKKFRVSLFPGWKTTGRRYKIGYQKLTK